MKTSDDSPSRAAPPVMPQGADAAKCYNGLLPESANARDAGLGPREPEPRLPRSTMFHAQSPEVGRPQAAVCPKEDHCPEGGVGPAQELVDLGRR